MSIRKIFEGGPTTDFQKQVLSTEGQVLEVLDELPFGYEYRLKKLSNASNTKWVLSIVRKEDG